MKHNLTITHSDTELTRTDCNNSIRIYSNFTETEWWAKPQWSSDFGSLAYHFDTKQDAIAKADKLLADKRKYY